MVEVSERAPHARSPGVTPALLAATRGQLPGPAPAQLREQRPAPPRALQVAPGAIPAGSGQELLSEGRRSCPGGLGAAGKVLPLQEPCQAQGWCSTACRSSGREPMMVSM